ncbi:MAG: GNAT family N-acyltransferase [Clostridia bacterium]
MQDYTVKNLGFTLKLAQTIDELTQAQELRYKYLLLSFNATRTDILTDNCEQDKYCDHLIVIDDNSGKVVGTYRLLTHCNCVKYNIDYFTKLEFNLGKIYHEQNIMEVGRAVVHPDYRNSIVLKLLWTGLMEYSKYYGIRYLFGTASYHSQDVELYKNSLSNFYYNNLVSPQFLVDALYPSFALPRLARQDIDLQKAKQETPPLIRAYAALGAKISNQVYIDSVFNCIDIFILFDLDNMNRPLLKRMFGIE